MRMALVGDMEGAVGALRGAHMGDAMEDRDPRGWGGDRGEGGEMDRAGEGAVRREMCKPGTRRPPEPSKGDPSGGADPLG